LLAPGGYEHIRPRRIGWRPPKGLRDTGLHVLAEIRVSEVTTFQKMAAEARIEAALEGAVAKATGAPCPPRLAQAVTYAVFPGGGRVRPELCLAVARACGDPNPSLADTAAAAVELLHCASLIQDDLPCFDDAATRRGQPALHKRFGEDIAILVGDVLIVTAFDVVSAQIGQRPTQAAAILHALARAAGAPLGIAAGQAWECEPSVDVTAYHHAKTAALFEAAAAAGALAAGGEPEAWREVGGLLGDAYQVADDLADALGESAMLGKPIQQDRQKQRPNMVSSLGALGAGRRLDDLIGRAKKAIPVCQERSKVEEFLAVAASRLCPPALRDKIDALPGVALGRG
jgi:geranylgeranyl diphosphate synthase, type II